jgi:hypothetical protein
MGIHDNTVIDDIHLAMIETDIPLKIESVPLQWRPIEQLMAVFTPKMRK